MLPITALALAVSCDQWQLDYKDGGCCPHQPGKDIENSAMDLTCGNFGKGQVEFDSAYKSIAHPTTEFASFITGGDAAENVLNFVSHYSQSKPLIMVFERALLQVNEQTAVPCGERFPVEDSIHPTGLTLCELAGSRDLMFATMMGNYEETRLRLGWNQTYAESTVEKFSAGRRLEVGEPEGRNADLVMAQTNSARFVKLFKCVEAWGAPHNIYRKGGPSLPQNFGGHYTSFDAKCLVTEYGLSVGGKITDKSLNDAVQMVDDLYSEWPNVIGKVFHYTVQFWESYRP